MVQFDVSVNQLFGNDWFLRHHFIGEIQAGCNLTKICKRELLQIQGDLPTVIDYYNQENKRFSIIKFAEQIFYSSLVMLTV